MIEAIKSCSEKWDIGDEGERKQKSILAFQEMLETLRRDKKAIAKLEEENFKLREVELLKEYKEKMCVTCKQMCIPKFNHDEACFYHSGLLRFFS